jgi:hypothetical protein
MFFIIALTNYFVKFLIPKNQLNLKKEQPSNIYFLKIIQMKNSLNFIMKLNLMNELVFLIQNYRY